MGMDKEERFMNRCFAALMIAFACVLICICVCMVKDTFRDRRPIQPIESTIDVRGLPSR